MLFYKNLYSEIFERYPRSADSLIVLSGYVGILPIKEAKILPFETKIIFGLFKENKKLTLHEQLVDLHDNKTQIVYSGLLCHSKCYLWLKEGQPIRGLVGSANFSSNGLQTDFRECLYEVSRNELPMLKGYIDVVEETSKACTSFDIDSFEKNKIYKHDVEDYVEGVVKMPLYDPRTGEVQSGHGLNWGNSVTAHVNPDDANIPIRTDHIRMHSHLFSPRSPQVLNHPRMSMEEVVELVWDDGEVMKARFEGTQPVLGETYPKQIATVPRKDTLGKYIRKRIGVKSGQKITRQDLLRYGRDYILLSEIEEGVYFANFSTSDNQSK